MTLPSTRPRTVSRLAVALLVALALAAPGHTAGDTAGLADLFGTGRWQLASVTVGGETLRPEAGAGSGFLLNELGQLAGSVGCNQMVATAALSPEGRVAFEPIVSTLMACPDPAMSLEQALLAALELVERYELEDGEVRLTGPGAEVVFAAAPSGP